MKRAHFARGAQRAEVADVAGVGEGVEQQLYKKEAPGGSRRGPGGSSEEMLQAAWAKGRHGGTEGMKRCTVGRFAAP